MFLCPIQVAAVRGVNGKSEDGKRMSGKPSKEGAGKHGGNGGKGPEKSIKGSETRSGTSNNDVMDNLLAARPVNLFRDLLEEM